MNVHRPYSNTIFMMFAERTKKNCLNFSFKKSTFLHFIPFLILICPVTLCYIQYFKVCDTFSITQYVYQMHETNFYCPPYFSWYGIKEGNGVPFIATFLDVFLECWTPFEIKICTVYNYNAIPTGQKIFCT